MEGNPEIMTVLENRPWHWCRLATVASLAVGMAGCAALEEELASFPAAVTEPRTVAALGPPMPVPKPPPPPGFEVRLPPAPEPVPLPAVDAAVPAPAPELTGLNQRQVIAVLGQPGSESEAASAKVWEYALGDCRLEVFFYYDLARADFYALQYRANGEEGPAPVVGQCIQQVRDAAR